MIKINKKSLIIIGISIIVVVAVTGTTVFMINRNNEAKKQAEVSAKQKADALKSKAIEAIKNKDNDTAKAALEKAKAEYEATGDTNNVVDTEAQLYFIEHPTTPPSTPGESATPVQTTNQ